MIRDLLKRILDKKEDWQILKVRYPDTFVVLSKEVTHRGAIYKETVKVKAKNLDKYIPLGWKIEKVLSKDAKS